MFESERVDKRFQAFLQQQCLASSSGRAQVQLSEPEAVWFLEQLALHATYGLFVGTGIYWNFGCPSWLMQEVQTLVRSSQKLTGKSFVDVVLAAFRESNTNWRVLAESQLPEFSGRLSAAVASGNNGAFPSELIDAAREVEEAFRAKAFIPPRAIQADMELAECLVAESLALVALAESLSPGLRFGRTSRGGYVAISDGWISFKRVPSRRQLHVALLGRITQFELAAQLPLTQPDSTHVAFALSTPEQLEAAKAYVRQAAGLRADESKG